MENRFRIRILACDKVCYEGDCYILVIPAYGGDCSIMAHHQNMVFATQVGSIRFRETQEGPWVEYICGIGIAHVANNRVTILVDTAEKPEDIDTVRARQALERAEEQLRQKQSIEEFHVSQASMARAMYRLKHAGKIDVN